MKPLLFLFVVLCGCAPTGETSRPEPIAKRTYRRPIPVFRDRSAALLVIKHAKQTVEPRPRVPRLIVFTASWCAPCNALKADLEKLGADWTRGVAATNHVQFIPVDTPELRAKAKATFGVEFDGIPVVFAVLPGNRVIPYSGEMSAIRLTNWLVAQLKESSESLASQLVSELHRVTNTQLPMKGLDVDLSDKTGSASVILAAMASGEYKPTDGVVVRSDRGLFPTRVVTQADGSTRFHFDQRPKVTARKWLLKINGTLQYVNLSADGKRADVSISGLPDVRLSL